MGLLTVDFPAPRELRGGWAALAAICAARGWNKAVYATEAQWLFHDGGGNWACMRFPGGSENAVLLGYDHEYSETVFACSEEVVDEEETNLLLDAPDWWGFDIDPKPFGECIGFLYGWDGSHWQKADYPGDDGFANVGLLEACTSLQNMAEFSQEAPGLGGVEPSSEALQALIDADCNLTVGLLEQVVPGWDIQAGIDAANAFLRIKM